MRFKRLDLNLLVALDVLLAERSITRAARRLNLSQSATSGVMARLREYFDDELLVQVGRNMVPTPLADSLAQPVRSVLLQIQSTIETKPGFDPLTSERHFRVVASDYPATVILAECARQLKLRAPGVTLETIAPDDAAFQLLERAEVDLLIMPTSFLSDEHPRETLYEDSYTCAVWKDNSIVGDTLTLEQYMALGHVTVRFGANRQAAFEENFLTGAGLARRIEVTAASFSTQPQFIIGTDRAATMHLRLARVFAGYYPLRLLALPVEIPSLQMSMQWHKSMDKDLSHMWLRALLRELALPVSHA